MNLIYKSQCYYILLNDVLVANKDLMEPDEHGYLLLCHLISIEVRNLRIVRDQVCWLALALGDKWANCS